jgi:hypothetical protein
MQGYWDATGTQVLYIDPSGTVTISGHLQMQGSPVTAAAGLAAGTGPPSPVVTTGANDGAGAITFGTGTSPAAGRLVVVTFAKTWVIPHPGILPHPVIVPGNAPTALLSLYVTRVLTTGFEVGAANAPAASQANTVYSFLYQVQG